MKRPRFRNIHCRGYCEREEFSVAKPDRNQTTSGSFMKSTLTVTRPMALRARISAPFHLKWLFHSSTRGWNSRVSVPAKTLSGLGYRGHVFWDTEIFILPFFTLTQPTIARTLLTYRYHTLPGARHKATHSGYQGAMFSW